MRLAAIIFAACVFAYTAFYYTNEPAEGQGQDFLVPVTYMDAGVTVLMPKSWGDRYQGGIHPAGPGARVPDGAGQLNWAATTEGDSVLFVCLY